MKLNKLVDIFQIIGVVAVILSLIFIGVEINQNTAATRASVRQAVTSNDLAYLSTMLDSEIIAEATAKRADSLTLNTVEREQLIWQQFVNLILFESVHYHYLEGYIEEDLWARYAYIIAYLQQHDEYAGRAWARFNPMLTPAFRAEVETIIAREGIPADFGGEVPVSGK